MKTIVTASDGHKITTTKGNANMDLREYIRRNIPADDAKIRDARSKLKELRAEAFKIRAQIRTETGFSLPVF